MKYHIYDDMGFANHSGKKLMHIIFEKFLNVSRADACLSIEKLKSISDILMLFQ